MARDNLRVIGNDGVDATHKSLVRHTFETTFPRTLQNPRHLQLLTNQNTMSTFTTSKTSENAPSKATGQYHSAKGTVVEAVGNLTGAETWQQSGKEEHAVSASNILRMVENLTIHYRLVKAKSRLARPAGMQRALVTDLRVRRTRSSAPLRGTASNRHLGALTTEPMAVMCLMSSTGILNKTSARQARSTTRSTDFSNLSCTSPCTLCSRVC